MQWFRLWDDMVDDPKLLRHSTNVRWVWIAVMTLANRSPKRGSLYVSENMPCIIDDLVRVSRESRKVVEEAVELFTSKPYSMLHRDAHGALVVSNWAKRQPKRDDAAYYKAQERAKKGQMSRDSRTPSHAVVTPPDSDTEKEEEEEAMRLVDWVKWYEAKFALFPSATEFHDIRKLQDRGVTDDLIVAVIEDAIAKEVDRPLIWAKRTISNLLPYGVLTKADYEKRKAATVAPVPSEQPRKVYSEFDDDLTH